MHKLTFIHPDHKLQEIYKRSLSNFFQIDSAFDGLTGLRSIRSTKPDIVISDYHLAYITGLGLLNFVRQHPEMYAIPFVFLSHHSPKEEALGFGATDWLIINQTDPEFVIQKCFNHLKVKLYV